MISFLIGAVTGALSAMGIGGGTLLMMWLMVIGTEQAAAQLTNLLYFLPAAAAGLVSHLRGHRIRLRVWLLCTSAGAVTAAAGSALAVHLRGSAHTRLFGILLIAAGLRQCFGSKGKKS